MGVAGEHRGAPGAARGGAPSGPSERAPRFPTGEERSSGGGTNGRAAGWTILIITVI